MRVTAATDFSHTCQIVLRWCWAVWLYMLAAGDVVAAAHPEVISSFGELVDLSREDVARGLPVQVRAVVTYTDPAWNLLFLHDGARGHSAAARDVATEVSIGDEVELRGVTAVGDPSAVVAQPQLRALGRRPLPVPTIATEGDLWSGKLSGQWVEVGGVVREVEVLGERMKLEVLAGSTRLLNYVRHIPPQSVEHASLVGARVRIQGVCASRYQGNGVTGVGLFIPGLTNVVVASPPLPLSEIAITPIREVLAMKQTGEISPRVRVRGVVTGKQGPSANRASSLVVRDATGTILVVSPTRKTIAVDDAVDVWGFPAIVDREVFLEDATHSPPPESTSPTAGRETNAAAIEVLRTVREVRTLSKTRAAERLPVRLQGVVTYADPAWPHFFLQDNTGALFVRAWRGGLRPGEWVDVEGVTDAGGIARMIVDATLRPLGTASFPEPLHVDLPVLFSEAYDCAWVELEGVVRSVADQPGHVMLKVVGEQGAFEAVVPTPGEAAGLRRLVNARVRLRGVCTGVLNSRDQWVSVQLRVPNEEAINVVMPAPGDVFAIASRPINTVNRESLSLLGLQRVRVRGQVTLQGAEHQFYLQDETGAILAKPAQQGRVTVGEVLDVVGYPAADGLANCLEEALFQRSQESLTVTARVASAETILPQGRFDRELVVMEGQLRNDPGGSALSSLIVQSGAVVFPAQFESAETNLTIPSWRAGSVVRLTGVCRVQPDNRNEPRSFGLLLRSADDVQVLLAPSWWTPRHAVLMGAGFLLVVAAVLAWVYLLRRQVQEKAEQIRKRIESEAALEKRLSLVWETSAEGMRLSDALGSTVKVNEAYCRMVGKPREELEGHSLAVAYQEDQRARILDSYHRRFESRTILQHVEEELALWNGKKVWFGVTNAMLEQPGFESLVLSQFRDVTLRRQAEAERAKLQTQLVQAQKMESVGRLAGGVAHDFNNMLQVILGNLDVSLQQVSPGSPVRSDLEEAQRAARRSADLTRQLLAFARRQTVMPKVLDLNEVVASMLKMLQRLIGEDIQLAWVPGRVLWRVKMDPAQLDQILANLTVNARDAIDGVGKVTLETCNLTLNAVDAATYADGVPGEYVLLCVSDNGPGMSPEVLEHLFEPFFTTKEVGKGTGLGLATVYGIVKQNGGLIKVHSGLGKGTAINICLPRCCEETDRSTESGRGKLPRGNETILLVEDEEQILKLGERFLQRQGYTVLAAHTPEDALLQTRAHAESIHLLITDVVMPGMNGLELKQRVEQFKPGIQCLFMSGYTADVISRQGVLEEGVQFLQKPFNAEELATRVRQLLDRGKP